MASDSAPVSALLASQHQPPPAAELTASTSKLHRVDTKKHFPFLDLPAELRLLVYEHLLVGDRPWTFWPRYSYKPKLQPNIIATCQLVREEATPVLYGCNEFVLQPYFDFGSFSWFVIDIGESTQYLNAFHVQGLCRSRTSLMKIFRLLKVCKALSKLAISQDLFLLYNNAGELAKDVGPLVRMLHRNQKKKQDQKPRDVLDGLHFAARTRPTDRTLVAHRNRSAEEAAAFGEEVKGLLRATFKRSMAWQGGTPCEEPLKQIKLGGNPRAMYPSE
ncbi:uncharacterized protein RHO25_010275 [Cercospora beticola]|uniref:Uncharacterized protein n=1 Tax=Cercospora beticola TaxID=122368 RepID=A0ABZ0P190_CERBT|nr:hypothetical protein RHO25_010275 [Cercospora beticola]